LYIVPPYVRQTAQVIARSRALAFRFRLRDSSRAADADIAFSSIISIAALI
jgi:hypothetical protein